MKHLWVIPLIWLLAACGTAQAHASDAAQRVEATHASPLLPAQSETPTPTLTATPTLTVTLTRVDLPVVLLDPTQTPTPTPTPTITPTPTATPEPPLVFGVIGDYGLAGQAEADVAALVHSWNPDFILTLGDNNYAYGEAATIDENIGQYYHDFIFPYTGSYGQGAERNRFFPVMGNHDWNATAGFQPYLDYFTLPNNERYYDFSWGPVHFFALDSDFHEPDGVGSSSAQAAWLENALALSTEPWNVVIFHHAPYTSGTVHGGVNWMEWPFTLWGADVTLAGHEHIYERLNIEGIPYFVNGLGGGGIYSCGAPVAGSQLCYDGNWGAMKVEATSTRLIFEFITRTGEVIDHYELAK